MIPWQLQRSITLCNNKLCMYVCPCANYNGGDEQDYHHSVRSRVATVCHKSSRNNAGLRAVGCRSPLRTWPFWEGSSPEHNETLHRFGRYELFEQPGTYRRLEKAKQHGMKVCETQTFSLWVKIEERFRVSIPKVTMYIIHQVERHSTAKNCTPHVIVHNESYLPQLYFRQ